MNIGSEVSVRDTVPAYLEKYIGMIGTIFAVEADSLHQRMTVSFNNGKTETFHIMDLEELEQYSGEYNE